MKYNVFMPCSSLEGDSKHDRISELLMIPEDGWSPRETKVMEEAMSCGDIYPATLEVFGDRSFEITTDLGQPEDILQVKFPSFVDHKLALTLTQKLAEGLI